MHRAPQEALGHKTPPAALNRPVFSMHYNRHTSELAATTPSRSVPQLCVCTIWGRNVTQHPIEAIDDGRIIAF